MLLERYYDETLAQASYLIGCEQTREAIVVDPNVVLDYEALARSQRMRLRWVTETHIHADFLSGSRELARRAKAGLLLSGHGGDDWSYRVVADDGTRLLRDGDRLTVGKVRLDVLHTPGHTPEHLAFLVTDTATGDRPMGMLSGDFLFVGDVGRPDLLERAANVAGTMEAAARQLYRSLHRLDDLPDYLQIWPGHGAGSACGKALGAVPQSTLGYERLFNPALQHDNEDSFARWVLADQPEPPAYFGVMKRWNRDGQPENRAARDRPPAWLDASAVREAIAAGAQVVDVRGVAEFGTAHVPGTINIPASRSFTTYAGTVLRYDRPVDVIVGSEEQARTIRSQLAAIGIDVRGVASKAVVEQLAASGARAAVPTIGPAALADQLTRNGMIVLDVRGRSEWKHGHIARARHVYLGDLARQAADMDPRAAIVVHCQSGARSSVAASLLMARGFTNVTSLAGGIDAWRKAGLPLITHE